VRNIDGWGITSMERLWVGSSYKREVTMGKEQQVGSNHGWGAAMVGNNNTSKNNNISGNKSKK